MKIEQIMIREHAHCPGCDAERMFIRVRIDGRLGGARPLAGGGWQCETCDSIFTDAAKFPGWKRPERKVLPY